MENNTLNERYQDDEIDLYDFWLVLKKRKITILTIILVSVGIAITYATLAPKVYRVSNTLVLSQTVELIKLAEIMAAVDDLNDILDQRNGKATHLLGIQENDLNKIKNIKASEIKGSSVVRVDIETLDNRAGVSLMEALPGYIHSAPGIAIKLNMEKSLMEKNREDLRAIIDNPVKDLKLPSNTVVYVPSIDLYSLREKYNNLIMMMENVEKRQLVSLPRKTGLPLEPFKPKMKLVVLLGVLMGCFLGIFVAFFIEWASNARRARGLE